MLQFLPVAINLSADVNAVAPQFPGMSIVAEVVDVLSVKFVKISTNASFESWQFCNPTEFLKIIVHLFKLLQLFAKFVKVVTEIVLKLGMKFNEDTLAVFFHEPANRLNYSTFLKANRFSTSLVFEKDSIQCLIR